MNAMGLYRMGNWCYKKHIPVLPKLFWRINFLIFNSSIPSSAEIGKGTRFAYGAIGVVIHSSCVIGKKCLIGTNVTCGGGRLQGVPHIGDNCNICTGAKIIGGVTIGNNCVIGANAVVIDNVPDHCVAAGVPAKIIKENIDITNYYKI